MIQIGQQIQYLSIESSSPVRWLQSLTTLVMFSSFRCIHSKQGASPLLVKQNVGHFDIGVISAVALAVTLYMVMTDNSKTVTMLSTENIKKMWIFLFPVFYCNESYF